MDSPLESSAFLNSAGNRSLFDQVVPQANVFCFSKSRKSFGKFQQVSTNNGSDLNKLSSSP